MNKKMIGRLLGQLIALETVCLVPALGISLGFGEWNAAAATAVSMGIMLAVSGILWLLCRRTGKHFGATEGMVCVSLGWILLSLLGALPFYLSREIPRYLDALFEIVSGFTTTGASVLSDVESLPKGILYWRSFSHWLGGMGVLVFLLAVAPAEGGDKGFTMHLMRAESPGPDVGKLVPRMKQTAMILYVIYVVLTIINAIFLLCGGMDLLEAVCTALGTAGTGGFGVRNDSMASYSPYIQNVTTVFMLLFGVNFSCYYLLLLRQFRGVIRDEELRLYILLFVGATVAIFVNLWVKLEPVYGS